MNHSYNKFKALDQIFYKNIQSASFEILEDRINVGLFPLVFYSGTYLIDDVSINSTRILYSTFKIIGDEQDIDLFNEVNQFAISFTPDYRKASIFRMDKTGILLKK